MNEHQIEALLQQILDISREGEPAPRRALPAGLRRKKRRQPHPHADPLQRIEALAHQGLARIGQYGLRPEHTPLLRRS